MTASRKVSAARVSPASVLGVLAAIWCAFLVVRSAGLYPMVFADEFIYDMSSRWLPLSTVAIPDYLYYFLYRWTTSCGTAFVVCARVENAAFFVLGGPFLFLVCRRVAGPWTSLLVSALSLAGPVNSYTAFFMPEAPYFFCFWVFTFLLLRAVDSASHVRMLWAGVVLGLSTLVKVHALFLFPPIAIYVICARRGEGYSDMPRRLGNAVVLLGSALAVKATLGYAFAGTNGLALFGSSYGAYAGRATAGWQRFIDVLQLSILNAPAHVLTLVALFAVGLAGIPILLRRAKTRENEAACNMALYAFLVVGSLACVSIVFTAAVVGVDASQTIQRVHLRYYNFALPLLLILVAVQLEKRALPGVRARSTIALIGIAALLYLLVKGFDHYQPNLVDGPELWALASNRTIFRLFLCLAIVTLALWSYSVALGARVFLFAFAPLYVAWSVVQVSSALSNRLQPDALDKAAVVTRELLPKEDLAHLLVVGSDPAEVLRVLFLIDKLEATFQLVPEGEPFHYSKSPAGKDWILTLRERPLPEEPGFKLVGEHFVLARVTGGNALDFKKSWAGILVSTRGLSGHESGGAWSIGPHVELQYTRALPAKFRATLTAYAFGPNAGKSFSIASGESRHEFVLGTAVSTQAFEFKNARGSDRILIDVPQPTSPKSLGLSDDPRLLGLAFVRLEINPVQSSVD